MIYAVDLTMVVSGLERDQAGLALRRILKKNLLSINLIERNTGGRGNCKTQLVNLQDALQLVMVLGGELAKETRGEFAKILNDFFKGKEELVDQIRANAASNSPIAQLARASVDPEVDANCAITKKRQLEREDALFDMEMAERKQRLMHMAMETSAKAAEAQAKVAEAQAKVLDVQKMLMDTYTSLCPNRVIDDRARLMFKDNFLNLASQGPASSQLAIGNGGIGGSGAGVAAGLAGRPFSVSDAATALKLSFNRGDTQKLGKLVAAAYREKYGQGPSKHEQWVDGASREVCSYTERDRGMVEAVIKSYVRE